MKKLVSLGVVSAMIASMMSVVPAVHGMKDTTASINDIKVYQIATNSSSFSNGTEMNLTTVAQSGYTFTDAVEIKGKNPDFVTLAFGISKTCPFAQYQSKPADLEFLRRATGSYIKKAKEGTFTNTGVVCSTATKKLTVGSYGEVSMPVVTLDFTNTSNKERYGAFVITLKDAQGSTKDIKIVTVSQALDYEDDSAVVVDKEENGVRKFNGGAEVGNGTPLTPNNLNIMRKTGGLYEFTLNNGVVLTSTVSKKTADEGLVALNAKVSRDSSCEQRYPNYVATFEQTTFKNEKFKVVIDFEHAGIGKEFEDIADQLTTGKLKRLFAYVGNKEGLEALANASGNDGVIDTSKLLPVKIQNGAISFEAPEGTEVVVITATEVDVEKLPAVSGVEIPAVSSAADNEIAAPSLDSVIASESSISGAASIVAPSVVSAPIMDVAPAATNAGQQNTGASDVVTLAVVLAVISMAAAGAVAYKKF